ncbi:MAG: hypothetical protein LH467_12240, partial [Gemmatimonadaceae bacterium]|nr:hypothetical protein [Gemmatimonadaceae bacterium]
PPPPPPPPTPPPKPAGRRPPAPPPRAGGTGAFTGAMATKGGAVVAGTAYRGAADPAATTKWWAGWTNYTRN